MSLAVKIAQLDYAKDLPLPEYQTSGSVAFDLYAAESLEVNPGDIALIPTGLIIQTPREYALILASRSSTPKKKGLTPPHGIGVIDQDYCGEKDEIKVQVKNFTDEIVYIERGERIAQGFFIKIAVAQWEEFSPEEESRGGFGSTGQKL